MQSTKLLFRSHTIFASTLDFNPKLDTVSQEIHVKMFSSFLEFDPIFVLFNIFCANFFPFLCPIPSPPLVTTLGVLDQVEVAL